MADKMIKELQEQIGELCTNLRRKLLDNKAQVTLKTLQINRKIYHLVDSHKPDIKQKIQINVIIRKEFHNFLQSPIAQKINQLHHIYSDDRPEIFIDIISQFWANYQRFTFALNFISEKLKTFFKTYIKAGGKGSKSNFEVSPVAVLAINQLKLYMEKRKMNKVFSTIFCAFLKKQREGKKVPRERIKQSVEFFQSLYFDFDADVEKHGEKLLIKKRINMETGANRHSTAQKFFEDNIKEELLEDCEKFYSDLVHNKCLQCSASDQIQLILEHINQEEKRGKYYILEQKNYKDYINCIDQNLIELRFTERVRKESGLSKFFIEYQYNKSDYKQQIEKAWLVYKRVFTNEEIKNELITLYKTYFNEEAQKNVKIIEKCGEFITEMISLNKKNIDIVSMLGGMLDFEKVRVESMERILSNQMSQIKKEGKYYLGAKHLANTIHKKLRNKYNKQIPFGEQQADLINLLKVVKYKGVIIRQYAKYLSFRLLQDIDINSDSKYTHVVTLQSKMIEEVKKETSENDVKNLQQFMKDISKSQEITLSLKQNFTNNKSKKFPSQIIVKTNSYWPEATYFDIAPPKILIPYIYDTRKELEESGKIQFELFNGISTLRATFDKIKYNFIVKNIYAMILMLLDEAKDKRLYYSEIKEKLKPTGKQEDRGRLELQRYLIELTNFGLLDTNKKKDVSLVNIDETDHFELKMDFKPLRKVPNNIYRSNMIEQLPEALRKAFEEKAKSVEDEDKDLERVRKFRAQGEIVKQLKHYEGKPLKFQDLLNKFYNDQKLKELDMNARFLKEILQSLISQNFCERVDGKKNQYVYIA